MKLPKTRVPLIVLLFGAILIIFFYPTVRNGKIPFPGDLLMAEYQPWRSASVDNTPPGAIPNKAQYFDPLRQMYPWKTFFVTQMRKGIFPLWNPHNFSGSPYMANFQSAIFYPLTLLFLILPIPVAWTISVILQPAFSLLAVYLLAKKYRQSTIASALSAISYAFCLYMTTFLEYNTMGHYLYLLPFALYCIEHILLEKKYAYVGIAAIVIGCMGFAGHLQLFAASVIYLLVYVVLRLRFDAGSKPKSPETALFFLPFIAGVGIGAVQLIPGIELVLQSARSDHSLTYFLSNLLIRPSQLILYMIPDLFGNPASRNYLVPFSYPSKALYVGIPALFFALASIRIPQKNTFGKTIGILTILTSLVVFLNPLSYVLFGLHIPVLSSSSPSNLIFLLSFGICISGGFGFDFIRTLPVKKKCMYLSAFWGIFIGLLLITVLSHIPVSWKNILYSLCVMTAATVLVICMHFKRIFRYSVIGLILVTALDLFYFFHKFNPFVPVTYIFPPTPVVEWLKTKTSQDRFWGYGNASVQANFATQMQSYSADGYDPLYPKEYGKFIHSSKNGKIPVEFTDTTRSDALIAPGYGIHDLSQNQYRLKILAATGTKYILDKIENGSTETTFPPNIFTKIISIEDFSVYEYKQSLPRFFLTDAYRIYSGDTQFESEFFLNKSLLPKTVLLTENPDEHIGKSHYDDSVRLVRYEANSVEFVVSAAENQLLYLSDTYFPGWSSYIDGKASKIYRSNYTFRSVVVPKGKHTVLFRYTPISFTIGIGVSAICLVLTLTGILIVAVFTRQKIHE